MFPVIFMTSMKKLPILDTNLVVRFLTRDSVEQAGKVRKLLGNSSKASLELSDLILAEIIYVLLSVYKLSKEDVVDKVSLLVELKSIKCNKKLIRKALDLYKNNAISFVDAYLGATVLVGRNKALYTFDRKLLKILGGCAVEPE